MDAKYCPKILGTATLNEKGQLVIPADARKFLDINPGDRLVIMSKQQGRALVLIKAEEIKSLMQELSDALKAHDDLKD